MKTLYNKQKGHRITAWILCFTMLVTSMPTIAYAGTDNSDEVPDTEKKVVRQEEQLLSDTLILEEEVSKEKALLEESTETTTIYDMGDGRKTAVFHGGDVRYEEENGTLTDYDPQLVPLEKKESLSGASLDGYVYENKAGDMKQYIPQVLGDETPILMEKEGYAIKMIPIDAAVSDRRVEVIKEETLTPYEEIERENLTAVYMAEDASHTYEYTSLTNGIKESIILEEKPENNVFSFRLETEGLIPVHDEKENIINLADEKTGKIVAHIDKPFMNDASGDAYSEDLIYSLQKKEKSIYQIDLTVSRKYLNSEERRYPVTIDPTATWKGNSELADAYVINGDYANTNFYDDDVKKMIAGKGSDGSSRTYMKMINLKATVDDKYIDSAYLTLYETGDCDGNQTIRFNRVTDSWTLGTLTWNNKPPYYTVAPVNSFTTTGKQYAAHQMSMTATVRNFVNSTNNPNYGIVMRNVTSSPKYASFYGSRTSLTAYRPKLVVTYYDKPTPLSDMSLSRKIGEGKYTPGPYMKKGASIYASWQGIESHNLEAVQYRLEAADSATPAPTSISDDNIDLTKYRNIGVATASGTNVHLPYCASLPAGKYRLYLRGKDAGGMYGTGKYRVFYVDGDTPSLTNVSITPSTSSTEPAKDKTPKISWTASDKYFSKITIQVNGEPAFTAATASGTKSKILSSSKFSKDGTYAIKVKAYDKVGKYAVKTLYYHLDTKGPDISNLKSEPKTTSAGRTKNIHPKITWNIEDEHLAKIQLYLGDTLIYTASSLASTGIWINESRFPQSGTYKFTLKTTDKAGNVSQKSINYYVDMDAPAFSSLEITPDSALLNHAHVSSPSVQWTSEDTDINSVSYSTDNTNFIDLNDIDGTFRIPSEKIEEGKNTIYVRLHDKAGNISVAASADYYYEPSEQYVPEMKGVTEYYGKRFVTWDMEAFDEELVSYELHRGTTMGFTPSDATLVEDDIDECTGLYVDKEILEQGTYYYKIKVVPLSTAIVFDHPCSNEISAVNMVTEDQFVNTLGQKPYLDYLEVDTPKGTVCVEKSSGNLLYSQEDFSLSNSQLDYGMSRTYNSMVTRTSMVGKGWTDAYHKEIYTCGDELYFVDADGSSYLFEGESEDSSSYICPETKDYTLEVTDDGYTIETKEDITYTFNRYGQLVKTTEPNQCTITNIYDSLGRLESLRSEESISTPKTLTFTYEGAEYQMDYMEDTAGTRYTFDCVDSQLQKVLVTGKAGERVTYDYVYGTASGKLETLKDGEGNAYTIHYAGEKADMVSYPDGEQYQLTYSSGKTETEKKIQIDEAEHTMYSLETVFDPENGRVLSITDASENVTEYEYCTEDNPYLVKKEITVKGYETIADGTVTVHTANRVTEMEYAYDENENVERETCSDGTVTVYTYDEKDNLVSEVTEKGTTLLSNDSYTYDANGNMLSSTDHMTGSTESYEYGDDSVTCNAGNATKTTVTEMVSPVEEAVPEEDGTGDAEPEDGTGTPETETFGPETEQTQVSISDCTYEEDIETGFQYAETISCTGMVRKTGRETYDAMGRLISTVENGVTTTNVYDFLGRVIQTTVSEEGKEDVVTNYTYNDNGTLVSESSSIDTEKTYTYDDRNRKISETVSGSNMTSRTSYTDYGFAVNEKIHDGISERTESYTYTETTRNTAGQILRTSYTDISGNIVKEVEGSRITHYTYDRSGNAYAVYVTDSEGITSTLTLSLCDEDGNNFARISQPEVADGSYIIGDHSVASYTGYDEKGNVTSETDGKGIVTAYAYDDENRLVSCNIDDTGDEDDISVSYGSTEAIAQITTITDAGGNVKTEKQDWNGLTTETADISKSGDEGVIITNTEYDDKDRKIREYFSDDTYIIYTYNGSSANISRASSYRGDANTLERETAYTYDNADRMISATVTKDGSNVSTTTYTYDAEGKKLTETVSYGLGTEATTSYSYDAEGRLAETNYPDGSGLEDVTYTYDTWGNLLTVSHDGKLVCEYTYDGLGQTLSMKEHKEAGASAYILRTYSYDSLGRCTTIKYLDNGSEDHVLESFVYTYDKNGQILTCRHINNLPAEDKRIDETRSYTYDNYGQLTESIITDHNNSDAQSVTTYTYDKVGNRTAMSKDGEETVYTYNGLNQLVEAETPDAIIKYTYDVRGNQTEEYNETEGITTAHTYSVTGEMTGLTVTGGDTTTLTQENQYNHEGIRISKTEGGVTRRYYYDNGILAYTKDGATVSSANVLSGDGDILGTYRGEDYHVYTKDMQNSAESIIKEDGSLAAAYIYSDFGETEALTGNNFDNEICYTGAVYDAASGLYYMNARYYDPVNGRFISQDTYRGELDDADQWHLYAYCANNPINYTDPSGHKIVDVIIMFGYRITKKKHYNRNKYNTNLPQNGTEANKRWEKQAEKHSACHQFHAGKYKNVKYLSLDGHKEAVYKGTARKHKSNHGSKLVTNEEDKGTYNFGVGKGFAHGVLDVAPYILWGNSKKDKTNILSRIWYSSSELRKSVWKKIKKEINKYR